MFASAGGLPVFPVFATARHGFAVKGVDENAVRRGLGLTVVTDVYDTLGGDDGLKLLPFRALVSNVGTFLVVGSLS